MRPIALLKLSSFVALLAASLSAQAFDAHTVQYEVFYGDRSAAKLDAVARVDGTKASFSSLLKAHGLAAIIMPGARKQLTKFELHGTNWRPTDMIATRIRMLKLGKRSTREDEQTENTIHFDYAAGTALATEKGEQKTLKIDALTADRHSLLLLVSDRWKAASTEQRQAGIDYTFVNGLKISSYHFVAQGEQILSTPAGDFKAIKLVDGAEGDKQTIVWLATELNYFPIGFDKVKQGRTPILTRVSQAPTFP